MNSLEALLEQSKKLPSLPEIYIKVSDILENENSSAQQIGATIQTDPSLSSRILKMVNSAYYGLPNQVSSIPQAVTLLGRKQLQQVLTGSVLAGMFSDIRHPNFSMREFWHHSIITAIIARHLAMQNASVIDHEAFFTAGLLHDIGRLVIAKVVPESLVEIDVLMESQGMDIIQAEVEILGYSHAEVSEGLIQKWGLPRMLMLCAARQHEIDHSGPFSIDSSIIYLANLLSRYAPPNDDDEAMKILNNIPSWQQTECTLQQISTALQLADEQGNEVMESLGMLDLEITDDSF